MRAICPAIALSVCGSVPKSRSPMSASPDSFSRTRPKAATAWSGSDGEAREALDDDVFAGVGRPLGAQFLDRLAAVLVLVDVGLLEQHDLLQPLVDLALGGALARMLGDVGHLAGGDPQLLGLVGLWHVLLGDVQRLGGGDVQ